MNPAVAGILGAVVRSLLMLLSGYLVSRGLLTQDEATKYIPELTGVVLGLMVSSWGVWVQYIKAKLTNTALALPAGATLNDAKQVVKDGLAPPATVQANHAPFLQGQANPGFPPAVIKDPGK